MHILLLVVWAIARSESCSISGSDPLTELFDHISAAKWPEALSKKPPARIERDKEGNIIRLRLDGMQLVPGDLDALRQLPHLESIDLSYTNIADDQLKTLADLRQLKSLQLNHTSIGDEGVKSLAEFPKLAVLCLGGVRASRDAVKALRQAKPKLSLGYYREGE